MVVKVLGELKTETLAERAYVSLREAIGVGELAAGERVTERGLAAMLSISPTPVREALRRLEQDGLIERAGPRTLRVAAAPAANWEQAAEAEAALRGVVARFAAEHATDRQLDELDALLDKADQIAVAIDQRQQANLPVDGQVRTLLSVLRSFDAALEEYSGNPLLIRLLAQTRVVSPHDRATRIIERLQDETFNGAERYTDHRRLVQALRARNSAEAERIALRHAAAALAEMGSPEEDTSGSRARQDSARLH